MILLNDKLHVQLIPCTVTSGGIALPGNVQEDPNYGGVRLYRVLGVGPGRRLKNGSLDPMPTEPGDRILCHSFTTSPVDLGDGTQIIDLSQVVAVLPHP